MIQIIPVNIAASPLRRLGEGGSTLPVPAKYRCIWVCADHGIRRNRRQIKIMKKKKIRKKMGKFFSFFLVLSQFEFLSLVII